MNDSFDLLFSVALGIGLAAATGFRVFVPLLVAGLAARAGWVPLTESFAWLQSTPALVALSTAAVLEILAFYIPGLDHLLDVLAAPLAVIAGIVASASVMVDMPPEVRWPIAVIAGGGVAALTNGATAVVRKYRGDCGCRDGFDPRDRRTAAMPRRRDRYCRVGSPPAASITGCVGASDRSTRARLFVMSRTSKSSRHTPRGNRAR